MKKDVHYIFDNTKNEFVKVTNSTGRVLGRILKYLVVTASLAFVYYLIFSLVVNTDSERKLKRENQMYKQMYAEMTEKEELVGDVLKGIEAKDQSIYNQLFKSDVPNIDYADQIEFESDSIPEKNIVQYSSTKLDRIDELGRRTEENFRKIAEKYSSKELPPLTIPLHGFSYRRVGASMGEKINPFLKVPVQHGGLDLLAQQGDSVFAAGNGVVAGVVHSEKGLGNVVEIEHDGGYRTRYAHLVGVKVSRGQRVRRGDMIGKVGMSGNSFAPHLHYEVLRDTVRQDPVNYLFGSLTADEYANMIFMSANTGQSMD